MEMILGSQNWPDVILIGDTNANHSIKWISLIKRIIGEKPDYFIKLIALISDKHPRINNIPRKINIFIPTIEITRVEHFSKTFVKKAIIRIWRRFLSEKKLYARQQQQN